MASSKKSKKEVISLNERKKFLEETIDDQKQKLKRAWHLKNLKVFSSILNFSAPLALLSGAVVGVSAYLGAGFPVYRDSINNPKKYSLVMDLDGQIIAKEEYCFYHQNEDSKEKNYLKIYSPWIKKDNGYERHIRVYDIPELNNLDLYNTLLKNNIKSVYYLSKFDYVEEIEYSSSIENIYGNNYLVEGSISIIDENDYIPVKESEKKNIIVTKLELLGITVLGGVIVKARRFDLKTEISDAIEEYKIEFDCLASYKDELKDIDKKILKLKKENNDK